MRRGIDIDQRTDQKTVQEEQFKKNRESNVNGIKNKATLVSEINRLNLFQRSTFIIEAELYITPEVAAPFLAALRENTHITEIQASPDRVQFSPEQYKIMGAIIKRNKNKESLAQMLTAQDIFCQQAEKLLNPLTERDELMVSLESFLRELNTACTHYFPVKRLRDSMNYQLSVFAQNKRKVTGEQDIDSIDRVFEKDCKLIKKFAKELDIDASDMLLQVQNEHVDVLLQYDFVAQARHRVHEYGLPKSYFYARLAEQASSSEPKKILSLSTRQLLAEKMISNEAEERQLSKSVMDCHLNPANQYIVFLNCKRALLKLFAKNDMLNRDEKNVLEHCKNTMDLKAFLTQFISKRDAFRTQQILSAEQIAFNQLASELERRFLSCLDEQVAPCILDEDELFNIEKMLFYTRYYDDEGSFFETESTIDNFSHFLKMPDPTSERVQKTISRLRLNNFEKWMRGLERRDLPFSDMRVEMDTVLVLIRKSNCYSLSQLKDIESSLNKIAFQKLETDFQAWKASFKTRDLPFLTRRAEIEKKIVFLRSTNCYSSSQISEMEDALNHFAFQQVEDDFQAWKRSLEKRDLYFLEMRAEIDSKLAFLETLHCYTSPQLTEMELVLNKMALHRLQRDCSLEGKGRNLIIENTDSKSLLKHLKCLSILTQEERNPTSYIYIQKLLVLKMIQETICIKPKDKDNYMTDFLETAGATYEKFKKAHENLSDAVAALQYRSGSAEEMARITFLKELACGELMYSSSEQRQPAGMPHASNSDLREHQVAHRIVELLKSNSFLPEPALGPQAGHGKEAAIEEKLPPRSRGLKLNTNRQN